MIQSTNYVVLALDLVFKMTDLNSAKKATLHYTLQINVGLTVQYADTSDSTSF